MKKIIVIIFSLIVNLTFGQSFKKDWTGFSAKNWTLNYFAGTASYLNKATVGQLIFKNKIDKTLKLQFFVFEKTKIDTAFLRIQNEWEFVQSCFSITNGKTNFTSFYLKEFYYLLKVCNNCNTGLSKECQLLSNNLFSFQKL